MKKIAKAALLAMSMLSLPVAAQASQFDYGSFSEVNGQNVTIFSPINEGVSAGMIVLNGAGPNAGQTIDAWCVDLFDRLQTSALYNIVPLTNAGAGFPNPTLTNQQISELGSLMIHGQSSVLGNTFGLDGSAAFQLAIWNVEYQGSLLDNASGALATLVAQLVANVQPGGVWDCPGCGVELLDAPAQNQVLAFGTETPLPAAIWLFGSGVGGAALLMRRRRKEKTA